MRPRSSLDTHIGRGPGKPEPGRSIRRTRRRCRSARAEAVCSIPVASGSRESVSFARASWCSTQIAGGRRSTPSHTTLKAAGSRCENRACQSTPATCHPPFCRRGWRQSAGSHAVASALSPVGCGAGSERPNERRQGKRSSAHACVVRPPSSGTESQRAMKMLQHGSATEPFRTLCRENRSS